MTLPPAFLDELRMRLPLSAHAGKKIRLVRAGREYKACCPFHNEKSPSFYINDAKGFFHCFGCGAHGDVIGFAMRYSNISFPDAVAELAGEAGLAVPQPERLQKEEQDRLKGFYDLIDWAASWFMRALQLPEGRSARDYARARGLTDTAISTFRIGYAPQDANKLRIALEQAGFRASDAVAVGLLKLPEDGREPYSFFRNRLIFPVSDMKGRAVAFGARLLEGEGPKYINSPDHPLFHKGQMLYNLARARAAPAQREPFIVVEGYMDVIALDQAGFPGAVAPLGTALTEQQTELLWRLQANRPEMAEGGPLLCFDGDGAGMRAAQRAMERLLPLVNAQRTVRIAYMPQGEDPDSLIKSSGADALRGVLAQSKSLFDALWEQKIQDRNLQAPESRARLKAEIEQSFAVMTDANLRALYKDELKQKLYQLASRHRQAERSAAYTAKGGFPRPGQGGAHSRQGSRPGAPGPALPILTRPKAPAPLKERILLAILINHPSIYPQVSEDFARFPFADPSLEALRLRLMMCFDEAESPQTLDAEALARYLCEDGEGQSGRRQALRTILSEATYLHAGFAQPNRPLAEARRGWEDIWGKFVQDQVMVETRAEGKAFRQALEAGTGDGAHERIVALLETARMRPDPFAEDV